MADQEAFHADQKWLLEPLTVDGHSVAVTYDEAMDVYSYVIFSDAAMEEFRQLREEMLAGENG